jgi:hypothetical protein
MLQTHIDGALTRFVLVLCMAAALFFLMQANARATWGGHCSAGENHHCYAISEWEMIGTESVEGAYDYVWTYEMYTPPPGVFVDNEMWLAWTNTNGWVESGQTAETEGGCDCVLHPFLAQNTNSGAYDQYVSPGEVSGETNNGYKILSDHDGNWSIYWELPNGTGWKYVAAVTGGYSQYATLLQAGTEVATESEPITYESNVVRAQYREGTWHEWVGAYTKATEFTTTSSLCIRPDGNGVGSTYNGTHC